MLCTEGLSSIIQNSIKAGKIHGFKASRTGPAISYLLFADDSLLFCKAEEEECRELMQILQIYEKASGQAINLNKSAIMFGKGLAKDDRQKLSECTGIHKTAGFGRYLGLPEFIGRNKFNAFTFITQKLENKISSWYTKFLSPAGKEVLLKAIATAIPAYCMSCFLLPKRTLDQMTRAMRKFWWSNAKEKGGIRWIAWNKIVDTKSMGGLGVRDLKEFNIALVAKQSWRILQNPQSLLSRIFKAKYFQKTSLLQAISKANASHAWRSILKGNELLKSGIKWIIGRGAQTHMWIDNWLPTNPPRPPKGLTNCIDKNTKVCEFINPETNWWDINKLNSFVAQEDVEIVKTIRPSGTDVKDSIIWMHTKEGQYSAKSGYKLQRFNTSQTLPSSSNIGNNLLLEVCKKVWKLNSPPKIKHFWWRVAHNAIPTAENLRRRKMVADNTCQLCGERSETTNHLIFNCRISKQIWSMTPSMEIKGDNLSSNSLLENVSMMLTLNNNQREDASIFPFIGWRIWKMRNDLIFNGKKKAIPDIINQALIDQNVWKNALEADELQIESPQNLLIPAEERHSSMEDVIRNANTLCFFCR